MSTTTTTTSTATSTLQPTITPTADDSHDPSYVPRGPVTAKLNFYQAAADGSKPFNYVEKPPEGKPQRNFGDIVHDVTINDIRGRESDFDIDTHAFAALSQIPSSLSGASPAFNDQAAVEQQYYPEIEKLLLETLPGQPHRVVIFDHTIRRTSPNAHRAPVQRTHIDQTTASAIARVRNHLPAEEAEELLKGRVRLINVWRPLNAGPVQSFPLAFADSTSVSDDDLVGIEHRYPDRTGETAAVKYSGPASLATTASASAPAKKEQKWYYWSGMRGDLPASDTPSAAAGGERLLLQCFDNRGTGARVPHTAFVDPRTPDGATGRESIEVRTLVFG